MPAKPPDAADLVRLLLDDADAEVVWHDGTSTLTRSDLAEATGSAEATLADAGVGAGSVVSLHVPVSVTLAAQLLAIWRLDAVCMLIDPRVKRAEAERLHRRWAPDVAVHADPGSAAPLEQWPVVVTPTGPGRRPPDDIALIQFSSGSTGLPKVVGRTAADLAQELDRYASIPGMPGPADRLLLLCSAAHTWGLIGGVFWGLRAGVPVVLPARPGGAAAVAAAQATDATAIFGVPATLALFGLSVSAPMPALRVVVSAGEALPDSTDELFRSRLGVSVGQVFGTTELGVICADMEARRPGSVGSAAAGMQVRVREEQVEVAVSRSPYLLKDGIERVEHGWLRTFDRGEIDQERVLTLRGRADSVVAVGGLKVDLMEVEGVVEEHPDVDAAIVCFTGVIEARVVPVRPGAVEERDLIEWCSQRLSMVKVPKRFHVAGDLPQTASGKKVRDVARVVAGVTQGG